MLPNLKIGNLTAKYPIIQGGMGVGISLSSLAGVHLYVNLESGHNHTNPGDGTTESLDVKHHCYHVVVHRRQRIRTPTVIHAAAFRQS